VTGAFISFEGIEGSGKSTQARLLAEALGRRGADVLLTAEPGGTAIGEGIRRLLLSEEHSGMDAVAELLLYAASRRQHVAEVIEPALCAGRVVVTDRFSDSTTAYQGWGRGLSLDLLAMLDSAATGGLRPGLTFLLDLDVETGLRRNAEANKVDRLERESVEFHRKVREGYLAIAREEPRRVRLLDASGDAGSVHARVAETAVDYLRARGVKLR